jgi:lysophospholipase L1-like esterase
LLLGSIALSTVVIVEGLARLGSALVLPDGTRRILCLGDSHTTGLFIEKSQTYPRILEALWNASPGAGSAEVMDMGFALTNSSELLQDFRRVLLAFRPDIVTVMIGANDVWTIPRGPPDHTRPVERVTAFLWRNSRAYRLLFLWSRARHRPPLRVDRIDANHATVLYDGYRFDMGGSPLPSGYPGADHLPGDLELNLERLLPIADLAGARIFFVTYAGETSPMYVAANAAMRRVAARTSTPLIDVAEEFRSVCPDRQCPQYLFPNQHPTAVGCEQIARILVRSLRSPAPGA